MTKKTASHQQATRKGWPYYTRLHSVRLYKLRQHRI